jgi:hypothetical protein
MLASAIGKENPRHTHHRHKANIDIRDTDDKSDCTFEQSEMPHYNKTVKSTLPKATDRLFYIPDQFT